MPISDELVERAAKVLFANDHYADQDPVGGKLSEWGYSDNEKYRRMARAALETVLGGDEDELVPVAWQWTGTDQITRPRLTSYKPHKREAEPLYSAATIQSLKAQLAEKEGALKTAVNEASKYAREAGLAEGRLTACETAGILDGWQEKCERLEAQLAESQAREKASVPENIEDLSRVLCDLHRRVLGCFNGVDFKAHGKRPKSLEVSLGDANTVLAAAIQLERHAARVKTLVEGQFTMTELLQEARTMADELCRIHEAHPELVHVLPHFETLEEATEILKDSNHG